MCARTRMGDNARSELHVVIKDPAATLDNLRQAVTTLEDIEPIARRVLGPAHPVARGIEHDLKKSRAALARATLAK